MARARLALALCAAVALAGAACCASAAEEPLDCSMLAGCEACVEMSQEEWQEARKKWVKARMAAHARHKEQHQAGGAAARPAAPPLPAGEPAEAARPRPGAAAPAAAAVPNGHKFIAEDEDAYDAYLDDEPPLPHSFGDLMGEYGLDPDGDAAGAGGDGGAAADEGGEGGGAGGAGTAGTEGGGEAGKDGGGDEEGGGKEGGDGKGGVTEAADEDGDDDKEGGDGAAEEGGDADEAAGGDDGAEPRTARRLAGRGRGLSQAQVRARHARRPGVDPFSKGGAGEGPHLMAAGGGGGGGGARRADPFRPPLRPPIKCTKCRGPQYELKGSRCGCTAGNGWQMKAPEGQPDAQPAPQCTTCPAGTASGPDAPAPRSRSSGAMWAARLQKRGAVCVSCPGKKSNDERTRCVEE